MGKKKTKDYIKMSLGAIIFFIMGGLFYEVYDSVPIKSLNKEVNIVCAIGDTGTGDSNQKKVAEVFNSDSECDVSIFLGDLFYPAGLENDQMFKDYLLNMYPDRDALLVGGNHDTYDLAMRFSKYNKLFDLTKDVSWLHYPNYFYLMKTDNDHCFIGIESTVYSNLFKSKFEKHQNKFLSEMPIIDCKTKTVMAHHPYKSSGEHGDSKGRLKKLYKQIIEEIRPDYLLGGHDHNLSYEGNFGGSEVFVSGAGAKLRTCERNLSKGPNGEICLPQLGYLKIDLNTKEYQFVIVNEE